MILTDTRFDSYLVAQLVGVRNEMGWNRTSLDNLPARLMCVVAELREFTEAKTGDDAAEELADVAMYLLTMRHDLLDGREPTWRSALGHWQPDIDETRPDYADRVREFAVRAFEAWRRGGFLTYANPDPVRTDEDRRKDVVVCIDHALLEVVRAAYGLDIHLEAAIAQKIDVLRERPYRNGGKHPDT